MSLSNPEFFLPISVQNLERRDKIRYLFHSFGEEMSLGIKATLHGLPADPRIKAALHGLPADPNMMSWWF